MEIFMKHKLLLTAIVSVLSLAPSLRAKACEASTLDGSYAGTVSGHNANGVPVAYQAIAHFNGAGEFSLSAFTEVQNGAVLVANASASGGTYTVNADYSGVIEIPTAAGVFKFNILIIGPQFGQFQMLETDGNATATGNAVRQEIEREH